MQPVRQALGIAHQPGRARIFADTYQDALACRPRALDGMLLHMGEQLFVHPIGRSTQGKLAQRCEVGGGKEVLERALGLLGNVDLAFLQALDQIVRGQIDELDRIGAVEDPVRNGFVHANAGDLRNDVVQAFDVLNVDGRIDVDAAVEQFLDIQIALGMPAAGRIGMRQLIHQHDLRLAREDGVEIHLVEPVAPILDAPTR